MSAFNWQTEREAAIKFFTHAASMPGSRHWAHAEIVAMEAESGGHWKGLLNAVQERLNEAKKHAVPDLQSSHAQTRPVDATGANRANVLSKDAAQAPGSGQAGQAAGGRGGAVRRDGGNVLRGRA